MRFQIFYTKKSLKDLQKLDRPTSKKIIIKMRYYANQNNLLSFAKKLNPPFDNLYRFRIGNYRVVFEVNKSKVMLLVVLKIGHRKDIYGE